MLNDMKILENLSALSEKHNLTFVIIGGHAINAHGFSRNTADLDLLVDSSKKDAWISALATLGYETGQNDDRFVRLRPKGLDNWPIDLMLVNEGTFSSLYNDSIEKKAGSVSVKVVSLDHLAVLKIHALKYFQEHRYSKDMNDLINILKSERHTISKVQLLTLCNKYADRKLYDKLLREPGIDKALLRNEPKR